MIRRLTLAVALAFAALAHAAPASAQCYADYQAGRGNPLQLHYGVIQLPANACGNTGAAQSYIGGRIAADGWRLLRVISTFGQEGLARRRGDAGSYFLRY
jgi:uncharacterized membrane protein